MNTNGLFDSNRLILVHKQATSARTRFLLFPYGGVLAFSPLPEGAAPGAGDAGPVLTLPSAVVAEAATAFGLAPDALELESGFFEPLETPDGAIHVLLARFTTIDPPFDLADRLGGRFVEITGARAVPPLELDLLRGAYQTMMG